MNKIIKKMNYENQTQEKDEWEDFGDHNITSF